MDIIARRLASSELSIANQTLLHNQAILKVKRAVLQQEIEQIDKLSQKYDKAINHIFVAQDVLTSEIYEDLWNEN